MSPEECLRKNGRAKGMADVVGPEGTARFVDDSDKEFEQTYDDDGQ